jgi:DNA repair protein RecN (Recombination protein N)
MLRRLQIKNYALLDSIDVSFYPGLNIITGETGAGKSILLDALSLILGSRALRRSIFDKERKCLVEAHFTHEDRDFTAFFAENEIDQDEETIVRREILPSGRSRSFINDSLVSLKTLSTFTSEFVDIQQQFETVEIQTSSYQLKMLDTVALNGPLLSQYQDGFQAYNDKIAQLRNLENERDRALSEQDFIKFQLEELQAANLVEDEQEGLENEMKQLEHSEEIKSAIATVLNLVSGTDDAMLDSLQDGLKQLTPLVEIQPKLAEIKSRLESTFFEIEDIANELNKLDDQVVHDPAQLKEVTGRLDLLYRLEKKHRVEGVNDLIRLRDELDQQLKSFEDMDDEIANLQAKVEELEAELSKSAGQISENRQGVIPKFEEQVHRLLSKLSMPDAKLEIRMEQLEELGREGIDNVDFYFTANLGSQPLPIQQVASGGELARLHLCMKSIVASDLMFPTLIFDEIDTGVSGEVAHKMGDILKSMAGQHQIICITHSPQVASKANSHFYVYKEVQGEKTRTEVKKLTGNERINSIASMLSGDPPTPSAIENAKDLLTT